MKRRLPFLSCICIALAFASCVGRKALPEELPLTAQRGVAQWWVISGHENFPEKGGRYTQAIVMLEEQDGLPFVNVFASQMEGHLPHGRKSLRLSGNDVTLSREGRLLAFTLRDQRDSTEAFFRVDRKEVFFRITQRGEVWASCQQGYLRSSPLDLDTLGTAVPIMALAPSMGWSPFIVDRGMSVFTLQGGEQWLFSPSPTPRTTVWMDFQFDLGSHYFVQIESDTVEGEYVCTGACWSGGENPILFSGKAYSTFNLFESRHSAKKYPLYWSFDLPTDSIRLKVHPIMDDQEMQLKRSSFWMGGIKVTEPTDAHHQDKQLGQGNMFIFRQQ